MPTDDPTAFLAMFPFLFGGLWLIVTTVLGILSGWFNLQRRYDPPLGEPLLQLGRQSGSMGVGVSLNGVLKLSAHTSGLAIGIWRVFGPFQRTFLVPWKEIEAEPSKNFFTPMVKLRLGSPAAGSLKVSARSWSRLTSVVGVSLPPSATHVPPPNPGSVEKGMVLEWLAITALAAMFFYFAPLLSGSAKAMPVAAAIGFPAVIFGFAQFIRYLRL